MNGTVLQRQSSSHGHNTPSASPFKMAERSARTKTAVLLLFDSRENTRRTYASIYIFTFVRRSLPAIGRRASVAARTTSRTRPKVLVRVNTSPSPDPMTATTCVPRVVSTRKFARVRLGGHDIYDFRFSSATVMVDHPRPFERPTTLAEKLIFGKAAARIRA